MKIAIGTTHTKQSASSSQSSIKSPLSSITKISSHAAEPKNIVAFAEKALGWMLEDKQRELLTGPSRRVILNCTRQWGKSWMAAVALLFHAVHQPESLSIVAGPTLRQSAELLRLRSSKTSPFAWASRPKATASTANHSYSPIAPASSPSPEIHLTAFADFPDFCHLPGSDASWNIRKQSHRPIVQLCATHQH